MPASSMMTSVSRADVADPARACMPVVERVGELGQGVGAGLDRARRSTAAARGGRGQADDGAAGVGPGAGQDPHGGGLAGPGRGEGELHPGAGGGQLADHLRLRRVEVDPVGGGLRPAPGRPRCRLMAPAVAARGGRDQRALGVEDRRRCRAGSRRRCRRWCRRCGAARPVPRSGPRPRAGSSSRAARACVDDRGRPPRPGRRGRSRRRGPAVRPRRARATPARSRGLGLHDGQSVARRYSATERRRSASALVRRVAAR